MAESSLVLLWTALLLGLRHSLDLDHVAAITDICAAETDKRRGLIYSFGYSIGHAVVVLVLGVVALSLGFVLPPGVEAIMGKIVGVTLLLLALAVLYTAVRYRSSDKVMSRWRIIASLTRRLSRKHQSTSDGQTNTSLGFWGSTIVGVLHGIGVESPTQLIVLTSAASFSWMTGMFSIGCFVGGMILANMGLAMLVVLGFQSAQRQKTVFLLLSIISALFGAYMGISLLCA